MADIRRGKGYGWRAQGKIHMQRCFECGRENWAHAIASGVCAWCSFDANESPPKREKLYREIMKLHPAWRRTFPEKDLTVLLEERYSVKDMRLCTVEQVNDLVKYMRQQLKEKFTDA